MLEGMVRLIPSAEVGFLGMVRNEETLQATTYANRLPEDLNGRQIYILDPMLATGGSAVAAMDLLAELGVRQVRMVNLVAAPEGIRRVHTHYPDLPIFTAAIDRKLNEKGYILPGLGDAGDRLFGV